LVVALIDENYDCVKYQRMKVITYNGMIGRANSWFVSCK
jgi:hypothetical protein